MKQLLTSSAFLLLVAIKSLAQNQNVVYDSDNGYVTKGTSNVLLGKFAGDAINSGMSSSFNYSNTYIGYFAGKFSNGTTLNTNSNNTFSGNGSGYNNITGSYNTFNGVLSGVNNKGANYNVYMGHNAGFGSNNNNYTAGGNNTGIGTNSLQNITTGGNNTMLGYNSGSLITAGNENIGIGNNACAGTNLNFPNNFSGSNNISMGYFAGANISSGGYNIFIGSSAGRGISSAPISNNGNIAIGSASGANLSEGNGNTLIGTSSGFNITTSTNNLFIGSYSGFKQSIGDNSRNHFIGFQSGYFNTEGINNAFFGSSSGFYNSTGNYNTAIGNAAGTQNSIGNNNLFLGYFANTTGPNSGNLNDVTVIGANAVAKRSNTTIIGDTTKNIQVGIGTVWPTQRLTIKGNFAFVAFNDGMFYHKNRFLFQDEYENIALGTNHNDDIQGNGNLLLGIGSNANQEINHSTAIGYGSNVKVSNGFVLGNQEVKVGIGTSSPTARLELASGNDGESGLLFTNLKQNKSNKFLTVNGLGQVVLEKINTKISSPNEWSDRVFETNYSLKTLSELEAFIKINKHLPNIPSAQEMTEKGIESDKLASKFLEKIEELTLYLIDVKKENTTLKNRLEILEKIIDKMPKNNF